VMGYFWGNVARFQSPNAPNSTEPFWKAFEMTDQPLMRLDMPVILDYDYLASVCVFWDAVNT